MSQDISPSIPATNPKYLRPKVSNPWPGGRVHPSWVRVPLGPACAIPLGSAPDTHLGNPSWEPISKDHAREGATLRNRLAPRLRVLRRKGGVPGRRACDVVGDAPLEWHVDVGRGMVARGPPQSSPRS